MAISVRGNIHLLALRTGMSPHDLIIPSYRHLHAELDRVVILNNYLTPVVLGKLMNSDKTHFVRGTVL